MYMPLSIYLITWCADKIKSIQGRLQPEIKFVSPFYFLICAIVDVHATLLIVLAYGYTTLTSVMLLSDFTIPSAVIMSLLFLGVRYKCRHYFAIGLCFAGLTTSFSNDIFFKFRQSEESGDEARVSRQVLGDALTLGGAFLYALSNILQEHYLTTQRDVFHYLGFLGLFGTLITLLESILFNEFQHLSYVLNQPDD